MLAVRRTRQEAIAGDGEKIESAEVAVGQTTITTGLKCGCRYFKIQRRCKKYLLSDSDDFQKLITPTRARGGPLNDG